MIKVTVLNTQLVAIGNTIFDNAYTAQVFIDAIIEGGGYVNVETL